MIGEKLSPILVELEDALIEFEAYRGIKPEFTQDGFRAATKIFMSVMMDKIWEVQEFDKMPMPDRENMAQKCGEDVRAIIKNYTGMDSWDFYK